MPRYSPLVSTVALYIIRHGLRMKPERLTRREKMHILDDVQALVDEGHEPEDLAHAARFGMDKVWPFSEGQSWDSRDFRDNVTKAKSAAGRLRRAGRIPTSADKVRHGRSEDQSVGGSVEGRTGEGGQATDEGVTGS